MKVTDSAKLIKVGVASSAVGAWLVAFLLTFFAAHVPAQQTALAFSHEQHLKFQGAGLNCTDCHKPTSEGAVTMSRPGHDSCNTCHQDWFDAQPMKKEFCSVCHTNVSETEMPGLDKFPDYNKDQAVLFDFSHKQHLNLKGKVTQLVGARLDCNTCHEFEANGEKATFPAHKECAICHNQPDIPPRLASDSKNSDCLGCHTATEKNNPNYHKVRRFITDPARAEIQRGAPSAQALNVASVEGRAAAHGNTMRGRDLIFSHAKHITDSRNVGITCDTCHIGIDQKTSISQLDIPSMWDCTICHESQRTSAEFRIDRCNVCHTEIASGRKPRNHTLTERPYDHTAAFRINHAEAARAPGAKCAFCHEVAADPRIRTEGFVRTEERLRPSGNCDECHTVMRPRSHTARWKQDLHGRMAGMNRMNCAVCHQSDFCIRCHNVRPRSHNPLNAFVNGGHRFHAQLNVRSCFTCHTYQEDCERCHSERLR